jgi:hypothetical protein
LVMDEALETAEAVAVSRATGEPPAADVARIPGRSASRRGGLRMDAAPAENWSDAANPASSTPNAVWAAAERQQIAARGGVASAIATAVSAKSSASFDPEEALDVSEDAILALFGQNRTAVLRMAGLPLQKECAKDWKMRCAQAKEHEKQGSHHASVVLHRPVQSGGGRGEAIRNIYNSDRQLPPGNDPGADSGEAPNGRQRGSRPLDILVECRGHLRPLREVSTRHDVPAIVTLSATAKAQMSVRAGRGLTVTVVKAAAAKPRPLGEGPLGFAEGGCRCRSHGGHGAHGGPCPPPGRVTKARRVTAVTAGTMITAVTARAMRIPTVSAVTSGPCPPSERHAVAGSRRGHGGHGGHGVSRRPSG